MHFDYIIFRHNSTLLYHRRAKETVKTPETHSSFSYHHTTLHLEQRDLVLLPCI